MRSYIGKRRGKGVYRIGYSMCGVFVIGVNRVFLGNWEKLGEYGVRWGGWELEYLGFVDLGRGFGFILGYNEDLFEVGIDIIRLNLVMCWVFGVV